MSIKSVKVVSGYRSDYLEGQEVPVTIMLKNGEIREGLAVKEVFSDRLVITAINAD